MLKVKVRADKKQRSINWSKKEGKCLESKIKETRGYHIMKMFSRTYENIQNYLETRKENYERN